MNGAGRFAARLGAAGTSLQAAPPTTLQVNVGKKCNQACRHCHVDASPQRTEVMPDDVFEACLRALAAWPQLAVLDVTGGAPELHPRFREMVERARGLGRHVMVRHNLTVQDEPGQDDLAGFFAVQRCEVICSLPHYTEEATDRQRGRGVYAKSIAALRRLNGVGYANGTGLVLNLVANPVGAFLPPRQEEMEHDTREYLARAHGVSFNRLFTLTNMPIARFQRWLLQAGIHDDYLGRLEAAFNPATLPSLMCRNLVSVGWEGTLYDCDFNQMLEIPLGDRRVTIWDVDSAETLAGAAVATGSHCFGCTAGAGSGCSGAIV